ncbi:MAG: type I restriction endonuclease [Lachnospiraceae bacterium]
MEFNDSLKLFAKSVEERSKNIETEEATKMSLIVPFFQLLGYDVFNPSEFCPEYTADVGIKKGEKVDYAILNNGDPLLLIECKSCNDTLDKHGSQLFRYFGTSKAKFGILTNGIIYKFFTDLEESNKMDLSPFLEVNFLDLKDAQLNELKKFSKDSFDSVKIFSTASELKYSSLIKDYLAKELDTPSENFVKHILYYVYEGQRTQKVIEKYQPLVKKAFVSFINDIVNQKITSALSEDESDVEDKPDVSKEENNKVSTTDEEIQAFYIIRGILAGNTSISDITYRDTESYFGILFQDNNRKPICRLNFDRKQKQILIPDENKNFTRHYIDTLEDIYTHKDVLVEVIKRYL